MSGGDYPKFTLSYEAVENYFIYISQDIYEATLYTKAFEIE